jgi:SDR family mycofactocin-dependent oxidoreductase
MTGRLEGKVLFVTGAARGQGRAEAVRLAEEGADVVGLDVCGPIAGREHSPPSSEEDLAETVRLVEAQGRRMIGVAGDVRNFPDVRKAVDAGLGEFGHIDIVVANAGVSGGRGLVHEISEDDWRVSIDVNLTGAWNTVRAALPGMIAAGNGGCVVLISSSVAAKPKQNLGDYGAAKAAVSHLAQTLAIENGPHNIRVNSLAPGFVDTPLVMNPTTLRSFRPDLEQPTSADVGPVVSQMNRLKGKPMLAPRDIANAVLWLASEEGAFVTGAEIAVDMGWFPG